MHIGSMKFEKTSEEILEKVGEKVIKLQQKVISREERIKDLRASNEIDEDALLQLLAQARQDGQRSQFTFCTSMAIMPGQKERTVKERVVGANIVNELMDQTEKLRTDKATISELEVIGRNLRPYNVYNVYEGSLKHHITDSWPLSYSELEFLGF